ncbi:hypothetical protein RJ640_004254 [Escallonia rubra]|uniref:Protein kinase domain-containing protein n=1 Tax=Escallonia rubra TaxID=112253 RepID=A0AA88URK8_9ASTE|nr:hypothetical protein RJ640_004254 [Escallonia rubra]
MSMGAQKVVVIQDASRDVSWGAIGWVLRSFSLKPGDELTLLGVLHQVNNPMGYKSKVDSSSMFGSNSKVVKEEIARKKEEYLKDVGMMQLSKQCETEKIDLRLEVYAGNSPKVVALKAAAKLGATWVVLDRQMKKDKKYFMDKLSCGISRMKRDNTVEQLRGPKDLDNTKVTPEKSTSSPGQVSYGEMIPGSLNEELSPQKSPGSQKTGMAKKQGGDGDGATAWYYYGKATSSPKPPSSEKLPSKSSSSLWDTETSHCLLTELKSSTTWNFEDEAKENYTNTEHETAGENSPITFLNGAEMVETEPSDLGSPHEQQKQHSIDGYMMGESHTGEEFENSICSECSNRRPKIGLKRDFTYQELHEATEGFSPVNFLSEGGFGCVYRGQLKDGLKVAVKQHKDVSSQGEKEFKSEVNVLSMARHQNLVMLLGSCSEGSHRLLVYEYVCNGSLDQHLSKYTKRPLTWDKRIKIALGAAKGLEYLHKTNIIHRDMRPNNILVTHDYESMLGDFGLARTQYDDLEHSSETSVVGTLGYVAPEYAECGKASTKTDVYSFGVVLLQLISGKRTTDKLDGKSLLGWARPLLKEKNYGDLIDQRIEQSHDVYQLFWMVRVAEKCLRRDPSKREPMEKVNFALATSYYYNREEYNGSTHI